MYIRLFLWLILSHPSCTEHGVLNTAPWYSWDLLQDTSYHIQNIYLANPVSNLVDTSGSSGIKAAKAWYWILICMSCWGE